MGFYLAHDDTSMIERVVKSLRYTSRGEEMLVAGGLNINLAAPEGDKREEGIATTMATKGLEDMAPHFLLQQRRWCRDRQTWGMLWKGR